MGCCFSTNESEKPNPNAFPPNHFHHFSKSEVNAGAFPPHRRPPSPEEETVVKEVLSETPIPKQPNSIDKNPEIEEEKLVLPAAEISEVSDLFSYSGSFSTTTVNDKKDDDGEVTQIVKSPARVAGKRPVAGENFGRKERGPRSPAAQRRHMSRTAITQRGNVGPANGVRRSRSPATRGDATGTATRVAGRHRSPSTNNAAGRFVAPAPAPAMSVENDGKLCKGNNDVVLPEAGEIESLENPLVSFECFIFL